MKATRTPASWNHGGVDAMPAQNNLRSRKKRAAATDPMCERDGCGYKRSTHIAHPEWLDEPHEFQFGIPAATFIEDFKREHPEDFAAAVKRNNTCRPGYCVIGADTCDVANRSES